MKVNLGDITNPDTNVTKDVVAKTNIGLKLKDLIIGGGLVLTGVSWIALKAFEHGANTAMKAEYDTLEDLGLFKNDIF